VLWRRNQQGEKDVARRFRLEQRAQRRPLQAPANIVDQREGRRRVLLEQTPDFGGMIRFRLQAEAEIVVAVAAREDGAAHRVGSKGVGLALLVGDRRAGGHMD